MNNPEFFLQVCYSFKMGAEQSQKHSQKEFPEVPTSECLQFSNKYLISLGSTFCKSELNEQNAKIKTTELAFPDHVTHSKITRIDKNLILIYYSRVHTHYFRYYDDCLNFLRETRHRHHRHKITEICLIDKERFVGRMDTKLVIVNIGRVNAERVIFDGKDEKWYFKVGLDKEIIIAHKFKELGVDRNIFIRTNFSITSHKNDYDSHSTEKYRITNDDGAGPNVLYSYILPYVCVRHYDIPCYKVLNVTHIKHNNTYYVICNDNTFGQDHTLLDQWKYNEVTWMKTTLLRLYQPCDLYTINVLLNMPELDVDKYSSVMLENCEDWYKRMHGFEEGQLS